MFLNKNKKHLYFSILVSILLFILLNFFVGPTSVFGLAEFIQYKTGFFFGVAISTFDYLLLSSIPICGLMLTEKRKQKNLTEILKNNLKICLSCILTYIIGLLLLLTKIGSPSENPLIPEYLRIEPFKQYSIYCIAFGLIFPFILIRNDNREKNKRIEEIGD